MQKIFAPSFHQVSYDIMIESSTGNAPAHTAINQREGSCKILEYLPYCCIRTISYYSHVNPAHPPASSYCTPNPPPRQLAQSYQRDWQTRALNLSRSRRSFPSLTVRSFSAPSDYQQKSAHARFSLADFPMSWIQFDGPDRSRL